MRTLTPVVMLAAGLWLMPALCWAQDVDFDPAACRAACTQTAEQCATDAVASTEACKETARAPCAPWCPCTRFIGAAYFNCQLNCETCQKQIVAPLAACDAKGKADAAECNQQRGSCQRDCGS
jgi:hypothetical protein